MAVKVVDASALAARLGGARLLAPSLLGFELANVCLVKARRHPEQREALTAAFRLRARLGVTEMPVDHDRTLEVAAVTGLTAYDAGYLWLARQFGAELVTLDRQLAKAATLP